MLKLKKIAVTGCLSSGKSSVCGFFKSRGSCVVDSDAIVHKLLESNFEIQKKVINLFGQSILTEGNIDRKKLASIVFSDEEKLKHLEKILHPAVLNEIKLQYEKALQSKTANLFVAELPLLFEAGFESFFDVIVTVEATETMSKQWYQKKTGLKNDEWENRMKNQLSIDAKKEKSHFIIQNQGSLLDLQKQVDYIVNVLLKGASC